MAVKNYFKVYGKTTDPDNIFPTSNEVDPQTSGQEAYDDLFRSGIAPGQVAKSQDVMTPLRETTIFSVAFLNWLGSKISNESNINPFQDAEVTGNEATDEANLNAVLTNIANALDLVISGGINAKEDTITKPTNNGTYCLKGVKSSGSFRWEWDNTAYQLASTILTDLVTKYNTSANQGLAYKKSNSSDVKLANKQFVYFDSESQDSSGNYILNLKTFNFD